MGQGSFEMCTVVILVKHHQQGWRPGLALRASEMGVGILGKWRALHFYSCVQQSGDTWVIIREYVGWIQTTHGRE